MRIGKQIVSIRVSRIERDRVGEISFSLSPIVAAPIDVTGKNKKSCIVRQTGPGGRELLQSAIVIPVAAEQKISHCEVCFG